MQFPVTYATVCTQNRRMIQ